MMIVTGGRGKNIQETSPTEVYDTETSEWKKFSGIGLYRHSCFIKDSDLYIYGGFENSNPNIPVEKLLKIDLLKYLASSTLLVGKLEAVFTSSTQMTEKKLSDKENVNILLKNNNHLLLENNNKQDQKFKISNQVVVVKINDNLTEENSIIRKVSIDKLNDEAKRIGYQNNRMHVQSRRIYNEDLIDRFIEILLRPFDWYTPEVEDVHNNLPFTMEDIDSLLIEAVKVIARDSSLVRIRSPAKVFGNIFGQYNDLMRFFESYGHPSDDNQMGDIHTHQYVFLGDFCDRGNHSLEVILLLLALKVRVMVYF
jgi:protein phosphatase